MVELLKRYLKPNIGAFILNIILVTISLYLQTILVLGQMNNILSKGIIHEDINYVYHCVFLMIIYTLIAGVFIVIQSYYSAQLTAKMTNAMRKDCFDKVLSFSVQDIQKFGSATLHTRTIAGTSQIEILILNLLRNSLKVPIVIILMTVAIFIMNAELAVIFLIFFLITCVILVLLGLKSRGQFFIHQQKLDQLNALSGEMITGARPIRAFNNEFLETEKLKNANDEAYEASIIANSKINFLAPCALILMKWVIIAMYLLGSSQLKLKMTSIAELITVLTYMGYFVATLAIIPFWVNLIPKCSVAADRILEILNYSSVMQKDKGIENGIKEGRVEFKDVVFGYNDERHVIDHVSFIAPACKTTAIVGTTGSGKTTLLNLLDRLYEFQEGDILIDGVSVRDYSPKYLQDKISYATQKAYVFNADITNNITAYGQVNEEKLNKCLQASCFDEVVNLLENGMDTLLAQGGTNISGGQKQRLSLARCLYKNADIYLLDDTYSALDAKTEKTATVMTKEMLAGKTVIIVAEKLCTIKTADKIIVMDDGYVVGEGTHEELLLSCSEYMEIYKTQEYAREEN